MKKISIGLLVFALVAVGTIFTFAQIGKDGNRRRFGHRGFERMAQKLNLTDEQKEQVDKITEATRAQVQPLMESLRENHQKLEALSASGEFNEQQVHAIADEQGKLNALLIVEKERAKAQIFQILTTEQREQAKQMKEQMKNRFKDKTRQFGGEDF